MAKISDPIPKYTGSRTRHSPSGAIKSDDRIMSRRVVHRVLAIYLAIAVLYGVFHFLATPGSGDWDWLATARNVLGWTIGPLVLAGFLPALFWGFRSFRADSASGPLLWCGLLAALLALGAAAQGFYESSLSLHAIPENASGFFSSERGKFVSFVRNACDENLREHPMVGTNAQQSATFCRCYADALADGLSTRELGAALTSRNAMSPELQRKILLAAPACRKQAFGQD